MNRMTGEESRHLLLWINGLRYTVLGVLLMLWVRLLSGAMRNIMEERSH